MGDRYIKFHQKKKPKLTPEQIRERKMKRNKDKKNKGGY